MSADVTPPEDLSGEGFGPPADNPAQSARKARPERVRVFLTGTGNRRDAGKLRYFSPERAEQLIRNGHARR